MVYLLLESIGFVIPGGSIANASVMYSALCARRKHPNVGRPTLFVSQNAHYSFPKGCMVLGLGLDSLVKIATRMDGSMNPVDLRAQIERCLLSGGDPFFVAATAGTTELGVSDPIEEIAEICSRFGLWFHIDGAIGGCRIFSRERNKLPSAIQRSDSFTFNWHKWMASPYEGTVMVIRRQRRYNGQFTAEISKLPVFQVTRRPNALKLWCQWRAKGTVLFGDHVDGTMDRLAFLVKELTRPERQQMFVLFPVTPIVPYVSFYYIPKILRNIEDKQSSNFRQRLDSVAIPLMSRIIKSGAMCIGVIAPDDGKHVLLRFVLMNSSTTEADVVYLLDKIDELGQDMIV